MVAIAKAGGIEPLVQLARNGSDEARVRAITALTNLAMNDDNKVAIAKAGGIESSVELARNGSYEAKKLAAGVLRHLGVNAGNVVAIPKAGGIDVMQQIDRRGGYHEDLQAAEGHRVVSLPSGKDAGVAMFSARFDSGPMELVLFDSGPWNLCSMGPLSKSTSSALFTKFSSITNTTC